MRIAFETLERRYLLASLALSESVSRAATVKEVEPQYEVHQPPRLQLGNAPLVGTPLDSGLDQVDLLWQTRPAGKGTWDEFHVAYRAQGELEWTPAELGETLDTQVDGRLMHSASIRQLGWNSRYEYQVEHLRQGTLIDRYAAEFKTRLEPGDRRSFRFVAYGDSATTQFIESFRSVQDRINQSDAAFATLLGDNIYPDGSHVDADGRFNPEINPEATEWTASHIDYLAVGNHDVDTDPAPSQHLFSTPIPKAAQTSPIDLPTGERSEFNYSFDYGDVHFTVIDSTMTNFVETDEIRTRIQSVIDYATADMAQTDAKWKVVIAHNPFVGTDKSRHPDEFYFQTLMSQLNDVGVDLVLTGDSHTYSWTYPMSGFADANQDGSVTFDEVNFVVDTDRTYEKDAGLIQVVAGVGGRDYRLANYDEPVFAAGYSLRDFTGPIEFGFAQLDVSQREIVVSYISAETGRIVGDTNGNGVEDTDEPHFGQFRIVDRSVRSGDLNQDGQITIADVDLICAVISGSDHGEIRFDLEPDRQLNLSDVSALLETEFATQAGDVNLDQQFTSSDLVSIFAAGFYEQPPSETPVGWSQGDWNCDGVFDTRDLVWAFQANRYD